MSARLSPSHSSRMKYASFPAPCSSRQPLSAGCSVLQTIFHHDRRINDDFGIRLVDALSGTGGDHAQAASRSAKGCPVAAFKRADPLAVYEIQFLHCSTVREL